MTTTKRRILIAVAGACALAGGGTAIATTTGDDDERPITGETLERARAVALEHTGGGRVTDTEAGDEEGAYEVEVTLPDGRQVDVHLDRELEVIGDERESGSEDED